MVQQNTYCTAIGNHWEIIIRFLREWQFNPKQKFGKCLMYVGVILCALFVKNIQYYESAVKVLLLLLLQVPYYWSCKNGQIVFIKKLWQLSRHDILNPPLRLPPSKWNTLRYLFWYISSRAPEHAYLENLGAERGAPQHATLIQSPARKRDCSFVQWTRSQLILAKNTGGQTLQTYYTPGNGVTEEVRPSITELLNCPLLSFRIICYKSRVCPPE